MTEQTAPPHPTAPARGERGAKFYCMSFDRANGLHAIEMRGATTLCGRAVGALARGIVDADFIVAQADACRDCARALRACGAPPTPNPTDAAEEDRNLYALIDRVFYASGAKAFEAARADLLAEFARRAEAQLHSAREEAGRLGRERDEARRKQLMADGAGHRLAVRLADTESQLNGTLAQLAARDAELAGVRAQVQRMDAALVLAGAAIQFAVTAEDGLDGAQAAQIMATIDAARSGAGKEGSNA